MINIIDKFKVGALSRTYQRIPEHPVDIYLGYSENGYMSIVVNETGTIRKISSSKLIEASMKIRADNKISLAFDLIDSKYENNFLVFCEDLIDILRNKSKGTAIESTIKRWNYWRDMFGTASNSSMTSQEIKGLLGELIFLEKYMIPKYGNERSVNSWIGPESCAKDFMIDNTWYEIKSISSSSSVVQISSIDQLYSDKSGELVVLNIDKTSVENVNSLTLFKQVSNLNQILNDIDLLNVFSKKMSYLGYSHENNYNEDAFEFNSISRFLVDESFPRIDKANVKSEIVEVKYCLSLSGIERFRI